MYKMWTIISREYKESVYKKSFIISTMLTPVILLGLVFIPALLTGVQMDETMRLAVVDQSALVYDSLAVRLDTPLPDGSARYALRQITLNNLDFITVKEELKKAVLDEEIDGFLVIPAGIVDSGQVQYYSGNVSNIDFNRLLRNTVNEIIIDRRIKVSGIDPDLIKALTGRFEMQTIKLQEGKEEKEAGFLQEYFSTLAFVMILYLTILLYGATIMRGVLEEKNSRVIEIMLSSANSFQLMMGKIIGLGSVGLTQYIIWSLAGFLLTVYGSVMAGRPLDYLAFDPLIFVYFILFFLLGYFLFATIYAGFGAISNTDQEAQQASFPVVMLLIIPLVLMTFVVKNPDSTVSVIMSMIPFFAPILMFTRINIANPSLAEVWGSILLLIATILLLVWIVSKVYRIGILSYGKKPTFKELARWFKEK